MKKIRNKKGYTLIEALATTLILLLSTAGVVTGMSFANKEFAESVSDSQAHILCSTLTSAITSELRNASPIFEEGEYKGYFSNKYGGGKNSQLISKDVDDSSSIIGEVYVTSPNIGEIKLIPSSAYTYNNKVGLEVTYNNDKKYFTVKLRIFNVNGELVVDNTFDVKPLNENTEGA